MVILLLLKKSQIKLRYTYARNQRITNFSLGVVTLVKLVLARK